MKNILLNSVKIAMILLLFSILAVPALAAPSNQISVSNFEELKTALEDTGTTLIIFNNDIAMSKKAININPGKTELVIDGNGHTLSGYSSTSSIYTINVSASAKGILKNITFQNMDIVGYNYHGIIIADDHKVSNGQTLTFDRISFTGPALAKVEKGNLIIRDSDILIIPSKECDAHEVAKALTVRLEGMVNIVKDAPKSAHPLFWITHSNGGIAIAKAAKVNISNNQNGNSKKASGFVQFSCANLYIRFEDDCVFNYVGNNLFQQGDSVDQIYIGKRSDVSILLYGNLHCSYGVFNCRGVMTVDEEANLSIIVLNNKESQPAVQMKGKGQLIFNKPQEVFIYNSSTNSCNHGLAIGTLSCDISITYNNVKSIEYWRRNTAPYDALPSPTYLWANPSGTDFCAIEHISCSKVKQATSTAYFGSTPWNTTTAAVKDINVIRVNGGSRKMDITVTVVWDDLNNEYNTRPAIISVGIFRNGAPYTMQTVNATTFGNLQTVSFNGLDKYDPAGNEYIYTVVQQPVSNYLTEINDHTITNVLIR